MKSNPININFKICGNPTAYYTLLFTDIFNLFPGSFQNLISQLESRYRIVIYTDSGFDENICNRELIHTSMQGYANDLINCLEENNLSNIIYMAHSVNAFLAFLAGSAAPHLFDKIILIGAIPYLKNDLKAQYLCGFQKKNNDDIFDELMKTDILHDKPDQQKNIAQFSDTLTSFFSKMNIETARSVFNLLITTDCRSQLSHLEVPTMILQASGDRISTTEAGYFMHRAIPNSQLVKIRAKGHLPQMIAPEEIIQAMEFFTHSPVY